MECTPEKSTSQPNKQNNTKKPTKLRCHFCKKKLPLIHYDCKCGHKFCQKHLNPHSHNCNFDYKEMGQNKIRKENPKIVAEKIIKI